MWSSMRETASSMPLREGASTVVSGSGIGAGPAQLSNRTGYSKGTSDFREAVDCVDAGSDRAPMMGFSVDHLETPPEGGETSARL